MERSSISSAPQNSPRESTQALQIPTSRVLKSGISPHVHREINDRLRRRYLERLNLRVRRLRKLVVERNWEELKTECSQIATSGDTFGFNNLTILAHATEQSIPTGRIPKAMTPLSAKENAEALIAAVDAVLVGNNVCRI